MALLLKARPSHIHQHFLIALFSVIASVLLYLLPFSLNTIMHSIRVPLWSLPLIAGLGAMILLWLASANTTYRLTNKELSVTTGFLFTKCKSVPIETVDNISTKRDLIDSLFGLVDIYVDTPEHYGYELVMKHVPQKKAKRMLEILSDLTDKQPKAIQSVPKKAEKTG
ncbi:Bacterial PH domain protein [Candidatus Gugararchaeum adminiculabundum]|nr:Bacterial PH domain protein [Candidatus Gugararchaeum adminiculabundum]